MTTITPNQAEINDLKIDIAYDITKDRYVRKTSTSKDVIPRWNSLTLANDNVRKNEESDWQFVYLARWRGDEDGYISWKLDLNKQSVFVKYVELFVTSQCFGFGSVIWKITSNANKVLQPTPGKIHLNSKV